MPPHSCLAELMLCHYLTIYDALKVWVMMFYKYGENDRIEDDFLSICKKMPKA